MVSVKERHKEIKKKAPAILEMYLKCKRKNIVAKAFGISTGGV